MISKFTKVLGALLLIAQFSVFGQVSSYTFTQYGGTFSSISGTGTKAIGVAALIDDEVRSNFPIGFSFTYNGNAYTNFGITANGWINMGVGAPVNSYNPLSTGSTNNVISAFGRDLQGANSAPNSTLTTGTNSIITTNPSFFAVGDSVFASTGFPATGGVVTAVSGNTIVTSVNATASSSTASFRRKGYVFYQTLGAAPNRTLVVEWNRFSRFGTTAVENLSFQIRLSETSNNIHVIYGPCTSTTTANNTCQVGLRGAVATDFNNREVVSTGANNWSTSNTGTVNTALAAFSTTLMPTNGQVYQWGPLGCTTTPTIGTISGVTSTTIGSVNAYTLSATNGTNIAWYTSTNIAGPYTAVPSATTAIANVTATPAGTVYLYSSANNAGCTAANSNTLAINVLFPGNDVCSALPLTTGTSTPVFLFGATTQSGEVVPPGGTCSSTTNWCNSTLNNTMWFTYVAPASGNISIQSPGFDTQLAIWATASCTNLIGNATPTAPASATLIAANDDDANYTANGGVQFSSFVKAYCLTPGQTYYIQLDSYSAATTTNSTTIVITDLGAVNTSFTGLNSAYCLPTSVTSTLVPATSGGTLTVNGGTTAVTSFDPNVYGVGTHTVTYNLGASCLVSNSITVVANTPTVLASATNPTLCAGSTVSLTASGATTYSWLPAGGTGSSTTDTPTATVVYTVTGSNSGCNSTANVSVTVNAGPTMSVATSASSICATSSATLIAVGATTYSWNTGATTQGIIVTPSLTTTYTVTGIGANGCTTDAVITQSVNALPTVSAISSSSAICAGTSSSLTASGANTYSWSTGSTSSAISITPSVTTTYTVTGTSASGCSALTTITQTVNSLPSVNAVTSTSVLCLGNTATLTASGANTYSWTGVGSGTSISVSPTVTTVYTVTGTDANGCVNSSAITQTVSACTGINEINSASTVLVYPNPATSVFNVVITDVNTQSVIEITDAIGRILVTNNLTQFNNEINISNLEQGIYTYRIINKNGLVNQGKIVKQ